jgi:guanylate kinase
VYEVNLLYNYTMETEVLRQLHAAIGMYIMPPSAKQLVTQTHLLVLCGVTAAGKNTISSFLITHENYAPVVSHTTRQPRQNHGQLEQSGKEYWFVDAARMLELVRDSAFVEVKAVHGDTCYGTSIAAILTASHGGHIPVMEIDVQGALELTQAIPTLRPVFILPPSYDVWMERLGTRGFISDGERERRLQSARMEIRTALDHRAFDLVVNHDVEDTARILISGIAQGPTEQAKARQLAEELLQYIR